MKQHEREYFVAQIRSGISPIRKDDITLKILNPTFEQYLEACLVYNESYHNSYKDDVMSLDEIQDWMTDHDLWSQEDEDSIKGLNKDLEKCRIEIFNNRYNDQLRERIRLYIRAGEKNLVDLSMKKMLYFSQTREGIAETEKARWLIENCTFLGNELYDFRHMTADYVLSLYKDSALSIKDARELARTEPWKSLWVTNKPVGGSLFANTDTREMGEDQRNVILWSQMYDNIQESLDCPTDDVINDDDLLDGWFIVQRKKREKEKNETDFEESTKSDKIKNAGEVYVVAQNDDDRERVEGMNSLTGRMVKKHREAQLKHQHKQGKSVQAGQFRDEQLQMRAQSNQQYKNKFGG